MPPNVVLNSFEIKRRRKEKGLTMEEAAKLAGLASRQHWLKLESGISSDCTVSTLHKIAKMFKCRMEDLITTTKAMEQREP